MSRILLPPWRTQPQFLAPIDRGASINRGLVLLAPLGPGDANRDLATGRQGAPTGLTIRRGTPLGSYPQFGNSDYLDLTLPAGVSGATPITIALTYRQTAQTDSYPVLLAWKPTGASNQFLVTAGPTASYYFAAGPRDGASSGSEFGAAAPPMNVDRACLITLSSGTDSTSTASRRLWINGVNQPFLAGTSFGADAGAGFRLGKNYTLSNYFEGSIGNFHIWNRVLTDSEAQAWTTNPFMTRQPTRRFWMASAGGGGTASATPAAGLATVAAIGAATAVALATLAAGVATTSAVGVAVSAATATAAAGTATTSAVGASTAAAAATAAAGTATTSAVGASTASATASSAAGTATTSAVGVSTTAAVATTAAGTATVSGVGGTSAADSGSPVAAQGAATVSAAGKSTAATAVTAAAGAAAVSAAAASTASATVTAAAGTTSTSAVGKSTVAAIAAPASGTATVSAIGGTAAADTALATPAAGTAAVNAVGASTAVTSVVPAAGVATVSAATVDHFVFVEDRLYTVAAQDRTLAIATQNRTLTITRQGRSVVVTQ